MTPRYCSLEIMRKVLSYHQEKAQGRFTEFDGHWNEREVNLLQCQVCDHRARGGEGYCYMWREQPTGVCFENTAYKRHLTTAMAYWQKKRS